MKRLKDFLQKYSTTILGVSSAFIVFIANTSTTNCGIIWFYEEEIPNCLKD